MNKKQSILFIGLAITIMFMSTSGLYAAQKFMRKTQITVKSKTQGIVTMPDLIIKNASWSSNPKQGQKVGTSSILNIHIQNKGTASAGAHKVKITCSTLSGHAYPPSLNGTINVPSLGPGKSQNVAWPPISSGKWQSGKYRLNISVDDGNLVKESDETKNKRFILFTVLGLMKPVKKPEFKLNADLEAVSISINPSNPVSGEDVNINSIVRNSGTVKTPKSSVSVYAWNDRGYGKREKIYVYRPEIPPLAPGQTFEFNRTTIFVRTGYGIIIEAIVDKDDRIKEINEDNNKKSNSYNVQCKPELTYSDSGLDGYAKCFKAVPGIEKIETINVYNIAGCKSKPSKLVIEASGMATTMYDIPSIKGYGKYGISVPFKFMTPGTKHGLMRVDATNTNDEPLEYNNELKLIITVSDN